MELATLNTTDLDAVDFSDIPVSEFSQLVQMGIRRDKAFHTHPIVEKGIEHYRQAFYARKGQLQQSTLRRLDSGWRSFVEWCITRNEVSLPASHQTIENYLIDKSKTLHRNTLKVSLWAISKTHKISGLPDNTTHDNVTGRLAAIVNDKVKSRERIEQASPLRESDLDKLLELWGNSPLFSVKRDLMIVMICYETLLRKMNLENMLVSDIRFQSDGSALIDIPFTKTNHSGKDEVRLLSPMVSNLVKAYLDSGRVSTDEGSYFLQRAKRSGRKHNDKDESDLGAKSMVSPKFVGLVFKRAWKALGYNGTKPFSGHSCRVGGTQDLIAAGYSNPQIMQAAGWSSEEMVIRYGRDGLVHHGAMAQMRSKKKG